MRSMLLAACAVQVLALPAFAQASGEQKSDDLHTIGDDIVVTAPYARSRADLLSGTSVMTEGELRQSLQPQIGEVIARQPGVSATSFSPGASRPVLRGMQGERIRVLTDGIGSIDVSNTSADHAVTIDPITAQRVEIIRGPASLLYGSSAIGGVVNVLDKRIPRSVPEHGVHVDAIGSVASAADEVSVAAGIDAALTDTIVAHVDGSWRDTNDLRIGGYGLAPELRAEALEHAAEGDEEAAEAAGIRGRLPNSFTRTKTAGGGLSIITDGGSLGFSVGYFNSNYGVPERPVLHEHEEGEEEGEEEGHEHGDVSIGLKQWRADVRGEVELGEGFLEKLRVRVGYADYTHTEFEGDEVGTVFDNQGVEGRVELVQAKRGAWNGAFGGQFYIRDFSAVGEEAFLPPNETEQFGLFTVQELNLGALGVEASGRYERTNVTSNAVGISRHFNAFSAALGARYELTDGINIGINGSRAVRAPSAEELFSNGPHIATQAFEVGDPTLAKEKSWGLEAFLRGETGGVAFSLGAFASWFKNYIYEADTGLEEDELPVFQYSQADATYYGLEAELSAPLFTAGDFRFVADGVADYVRAKIDSVGPAPRIPPLRVLGGIEAQSDLVTGRVEVEWSDKQTRVAAFETETGSHTLVNASVLWRVLGADSPATLQLSANNLFDVDARRHASFTKDYVPLAGRDVRATLSLSF
ncbi:TonB-dependent receptor [Sphingosinicella sp.]|jgi:iron complex outermembrane receptor protein|uniref:TonB-dependent receptor n=1 Tax=Sphingosinicella sp. TaxID=1917971 RepID=UPI00184C7046|nr:TonB-dependent receptor [Sphingosinicella sp.]MBA4759325.1 TonB-dependent receptor [Sphingosinicella sp.]